MRVKHSHTLENMVEVTLVAGTNTVTMVRDCHLKCQMAKWPTKSLRPIIGWRLCFACKMDNYINEKKWLSGYRKTKITANDNDGPHPLAPSPTCTRGGGEIMFLDF
jgi:hypothetical protein